jgi:hypothetical protein
MTSAVCLDVMLVILWHIWKARNALNFNSKESTAAVVLRSANSDLSMHIQA